jgi:hypothetical protein
MRITSWASLLALAAATAACAAPADGRAPTPMPAPTPAVQVQAQWAALGQTRLSFAVGTAAPTTLVVERDAQVPPQAHPGRVQVLATLGATAVVLVDDYPSRLSGGQGECGAGRERFLRVVRIAPGPATLTYSTKLASCWKDVELDPEFGARGLQWSASPGEAAELRIEWFSGPTAGKPESRRLRIAPDGRVTVVKGA